MRSALGRQKDRNVRREPRVAVAIQDPENPYRYVEVRGKVKEITEKGADEHIDAAAIDRQADIPADVIEGLAKLGVLWMTAPPEQGGRGFTQSGYCRIMEVIGGHDASTAVFVNAHHSIGIRALLLFGTP